jgi:DNA-binding NtrC family response regulator
MSERILVVDDEFLIATAVERALSRVGYVLAKAQNMKELEEVLKGAPFDLLITDVHMKEDSLSDIIEKVRQTSPAIKILRMSGSVDGGGFGDFIEKPFGIEDLRKKVREILDGSS